MVGGEHSIRPSVQAPVETLHVPPPGQFVAYWQPDPSTHVSVVHTTPSLQATGAPTQAPPAQVSPVVQESPSLHAIVLLTFAHPVAGTHESVVQTFPSLQLSGVPG